MLRLSKSDEEFQRIYRDHEAGVRRALLGMTGNSSIAEELTQEAFIKAWKGLAQFGLRSSLKTWIYKIAINLGRDWLRVHKNTHSPSIPEVGEENFSVETLAIQEALSEVDEDTRSILVLHYYEGMKLQEMARVLEIPLGTVKSRLHTAKGRLQQLLLKKGFNV